MKIIDSHVHFFDATRGDGVVWPPIDSPVYGDGIALPAQRAALAADKSLAGVVAVETSRRDVDDHWLLELAGNNSRILGTVLNLRPDQSGFSARLERASRSPKFVGLRLRPVTHYNFGSRRLLRNLAKIEKLTKTIEFGAPDSALKATFAQLAERLAGTRLILDHAGHPCAGCHTDEGWLGSMRDISVRPNVYVKVTDFIGKLPDWPSTLDVLLNLFGPDRLLYGSNWPVSEVCQVAELGEFLAADAAGFFSDNARAAYQI